MCSKRDLRGDTGLLRESEPGRAGRHVVHNVLALDEDVAEDAEADAGVGLHATEAGVGAVGGGCVVDVLSGNDLLDAADGDAEVRQGGAAWESVAALAVVEHGSRDLGVVGLCDGGGDVHQSCAGVDNASNAAAGGGGSADGVSGSSEAPETLAVINIDVGDGTGVL